MRRIYDDELKSIQLDILKFVHDFCQANSIKYFLAYGTLLGAIRHGGYIPWDDDIDIAMMRPDYEKFIEEFSKQKSKYRVLSVRSSEYQYPFAKVDRTDTVMKEFSNLKTEIGINIDIFPIDYLPLGKEKMFFDKVNKYFKLYTFKCVKCSPQIALYKNIILRLFQICFKYVSFNYLCSKIDLLAKQSRESGLCANIVASYGFNEVTDVLCFNKVVDISFEGCLFKAPLDGHQWLTNIFGDYMQLPPESKRVSHHVYEAYLK